MVQKGVGKGSASICYSLLCLAGMQLSTCAFLCKHNQRASQHSSAVHLSICQSWADRSAASGSWSSTSRSMGRHCPSEDIIAPFVRGVLPFTAARLPFATGVLPFAAGGLPFTVGSLPFTAAALPVNPAACGWQKAFKQGCSSCWTWDEL